LRQLALELRKQDEEYQQIYSQTLQQIADRYYEARQRFLDGLARFPRRRNPISTTPWFIRRAVGGY